MSKGNKAVRLTEEEEKMVRNIRQLNIEAELLKGVLYAKNSKSQEMLYEILGKIKMAYNLGVITCEKYLELDSMVVRDGLNNPEYIKVWNSEYFG